MRYVWINDRERDSVWDDEDDIYFGMADEIMYLPEGGYRAEVINWLTTSEIRDGLRGLKQGSFPMKLLTKRYKNDHENGHVNWINMITKNLFYAKLRAYERKLIQSLPSHDEMIPWISTYVDRWCGDGKSMELLLNTLYGEETTYQWNQRKKDTHVALIDVAAVAVGEAKSVMENVCGTTDTHIGDMFRDDYMERYANKSSVLYCSLGNTEGNESREQKDIARQKQWYGGYSLTSRFRYPKTEEAKKFMLKSYGADPEGDNTAWYATSKKQIWDTLYMLWFSDKQLENCDFIVQFTEQTSWWEPGIEVGIMPKECVKVASCGVEETYEALVFYKVYDSGEEVDSDGESIADLWSVGRHKPVGQHDYVVNSRENDFARITLKKLYPGKKKVVVDIAKRASLRALTGSVALYILFAAAQYSGVFTKEKQKYSKADEKEFADRISWSWFGLSSNELIDRSKKLQNAIQVLMFGDQRKYRVEDIWSRERNDVNLDEMDYLHDDILWAVQGTVMDISTYQDSIKKTVSQSFYKTLWAVMQENKGAFVAKKTWYVTGLFGGERYFHMQESQSHLKSDYWISDFTDQEMHDKVWWGVDSILSKICPYSELYTARWKSELQKAIVWGDEPINFFDDDWDPVAIYPIYTGKEKNTNTSYGDTVYRFMLFVPENPKHSMHSRYDLIRYSTDQCNKLWELYETYLAIRSWPYVVWW